MHTETNGPLTDIPQHPDLSPPHNTTVCQVLSTMHVSIHETLTSKSAAVRNVLKVGGHDITAQTSLSRCPVGPTLLANNSMSDAIITI